MKRKTKKKSMYYYRFTITSDDLCFKAKNITEARKIAAKRAVKATRRLKKGCEK